MKKLLLSMVGVLMALPALAKDFEYTYEGQTLTYTVLSETEKTVQTKAGKWNATGNSVTGVLVIPSTINSGDYSGYKVTKIGDRAFYGCSGLTSVTIPESVTSIGFSAFFDCSGLTSVTIPESVTTIDTYAFYECSGLTSIISLCETAPYIKTSSFDGLYETVQVIVPDNSLNNYLCSNWSLFSNLSTKGGVKADAFSDDIFQFRVNGENSAMLMAGNYADMESVSIPERVVFNDKFYFVTYICDNAFKDCNKIKSLVLPKRLEVIGQSAFEGAFIPLADFNFPASLLRIEDSSFKNCTGLNNVVIPEKVGYIGREAFSGSSVSKINLPTSPGVSCFIGTQNLAEVSFSEKVDTIAENAFRDCTKLQTLSLPQSLQTIGKSAFDGCTGLAEVSFNQNLSEIGDSAFSVCTGLTKVSFNQNLSKIGDYAFDGCTGLTKVSFNQSLSKIGDYAFDGCTGLTEVSFNQCQNLSEIGRYAFWRCTGLTEVYFNQNLSKIGHSAFEDCSGLTKVSFNQDLSEIGPLAFAGCTGLTEVSFNQSLSKIGSSAFAICTGLTEVSFNQNLSEIGNYAFKNCSGLTKVSFNQNLSKIGDEAFGKCTGLTELIIPNSVTAIGADAFSGCSNLSFVTFEEGTSPISISNAFGDSPVSVLNMGRNWESSIPFGSTLKTLNLGNTVTEIPEKAFSGFSKLTSVTFGSSVDSIGADAFKDCALTDLVLSPATVTIGENAFMGNDLKNIAIGAKVTKIGANAFSGANNLEGVSITALTPPNAENTTFSYYGCPLYVSPSENDVVKDAYYNFTRCWYRFSSCDLIPIEKLKINGNSSVELKPGETLKLSVTFTPENASLPYIFWQSTNPDIATVDREGNVKLNVGNNNGVEPYSDGVESCQIIARTLYSDVPAAVVTINYFTGGIEDVIADPDNAQGISRPNDIYNLHGICLKRNATDDDVKALAPALYIIGGKKVFVR